MSATSGGTLWASAPPRPNRSAMSSTRPPRRVDLEKLVVTVGVSRVDLHGEDRVQGGELGAFTCGGVLNPVPHANDVTRSLPGHAAKIHGSAAAVAALGGPADVTC